MFQQGPIEVPLQSFDQPGLFVLPQNPDLANYYSSYAYGHQKTYHHHGFLHTALIILRILVIFLFIATLISAALVRNNDFTNRIVDNSNSAVWISTIVFAAVGFLVSILILILVLATHSRIVNLLAAIFDIIWFIPMVILGAFCANRERRLPFFDARILSINRSVFGITAAFALFTAIVLLILAILGFIYASRCRRAKNGA